MKNTRLFMGALVAALSLLACTEEPLAQEGTAQVAISGLSGALIDSMVVTAQPANVSKALAYSADGGTFSGQLVLPVGSQTLTANGYQGDGGTLVAQGSASVDIQANVTSAVTIRIYDLTPQEPTPDIAPIIRSVTASKANLVVGESITVSVDAVDLDGDPLSHAWTSDCASATFANPSAASTTWSSSASGACTLTVTVASRSSSATESVNVSVFSSSDGGTAEGAASVTGEYVARPQVRSLSLYTAGGSTFSYFNSLYRYFSAANFPPVPAGEAFFIQVEVNFDTRFGTFQARPEVVCDGIEQALALSSDSCATYQGGSCYATYGWTPSAPGVCKVTGHAANGTLTDSFSAGLVVR